MIGGVLSTDLPLATVRQVLIVQLDSAINRLGRGAPTDHVIHQVRRDLKRARAALRLLRSCIGAPEYHRHNVLIRDAARPLTAVRDSKVMLETLRGLALDPLAQRPGEAAVKTGDPFVRLLNRELHRERAEARRRLGARELRAAAAAMRAVRRAIEAVADAQLRQGTLGVGLERTYSAARKAYARVTQRSTDERLHEWRKQTRYSLNELDMVAPLDRDKFKQRRKRARRLAQLLGDDHDLAVLNSKIFQHAKGPHAASRNAAVEDLMSRLAHRRKVLQDKARRLGRGLYSEKPNRMRKKFDRSLRAARATAPEAQGQYSAMAARMLRAIAMRHSPTRRS